MPPTLEEIAARLQALAGSANLGLVIGEACRLGQPERLCLPLGTVALKGRDAPLEVWLPLARRAGEDAAQDARARQWRRLRDAESAGDLAAAHAGLAELESAAPDDALCAWQRQRWAAAGES